MQLDTDLTGLLGVTLAIIALAARLPGLRTLPQRKQAGVLMGVLIVLSIPVWGLSLSGFVRGITGDLSIMTLVLLVLSLAHTISGHVLVEPQSRLKTLRVILLIAALFYPLALGIGMFDPYRLGYGNVWFMAVLLALAIWASLRFSTLLAWCLTLAVAAWTVGWYESTNLWDYLLDPWLAVYAFAAELKLQLTRWRGKAHA